MAGIGTFTNRDWSLPLPQVKALQEAGDKGIAPHAGAVVQGLVYLPGNGEKNFQVRLLLMAAVHVSLISTVAQLACLQMFTPSFPAQVSARAFDTMAVVAATWPVSKRDAFVALPGLADKMADMKLKGPAGDALTAMSEACGPQFVCTQLHKKAAGHKNPKVSRQHIYLLQFIFHDAAPAACLHAGPAKVGWPAEWDTTSRCCLVSTARRKTSDLRHPRCSMRPLRQHRPLAPART